MASLYTVNTASQTVTTGSMLAFATNVVKTGCSKVIQHTAGSSVVTIPYAGVYKVTVCADLIPASSGNVTLSLLNNDNVVVGGEATVTGATTSTSHISFTALVRVLPSCYVVSNEANLQVMISAGATITNLSMTVTEE